MSLNILSFTTFILCDEDKKFKYDKILKFIELLGVLYGGIVFGYVSFFIVLMFYVGESNRTLNLATLLFWTLIIVFLTLNYLSIMGYFNLRFYPLKKLNPIIIKPICYTLLSTVLVNVIFTILILVFSFNFSLKCFLPLSAGILYFKTLLIAKDNF